mgnify:CR=1 FL=1
MALDVRDGNYRKIANDGYEVFKRFLPSRNLRVRSRDCKDGIWLIFGNGKGCFSK